MIGEGDMERGLLGCMFHVYSFIVLGYWPYAGKHCVCASAGAHV